MDPAAPAAENPGIKRQSPIIARAQRWGSNREFPGSPLPSTIAYVLLTLITLGLWRVEALPAPWIAVSAVSFFLASLLQIGRHFTQASRRRRAADLWLRHAKRCSPTSPHAWRAAELCSPSERNKLAKTLRWIVSDADSARGRRIAATVNRSVIRQHSQHISTLASRLEALHQPVTPAGILLVHELLTEGSGPLYNSDKAEQLSAAIEAIQEEFAN